MSAPADRSNQSSTPSTSSTSPTVAPPIGTVVRTHPPAKLNLFLELVGKRDDGFHEIDTIMVPIDWRDQLDVRRISAAASDQHPVTLNVEWLPSRRVVADRLGLTPGSDREQAMLSIPGDSSNLVCRSLQRFISHYRVDGGFDARLLKSIPAGAGMGGASSNAASALRCAATLCGISCDDAGLFSIAAEIGSDVPFFLGVASDHPASADQHRNFPALGTVAAAWATGRGEVLAPVQMVAPLDVVVVYPSVALSTGKVYAAAKIPQNRASAQELVQALQTGNLSRIRQSMMNRLSAPAQLLAPQIDEILQSVWRTAGRTCQLTGSGSACFVVTGSEIEAKRFAKRFSAMVTRRDETAGQRELGGRCSDPVNRGASNNSGAMVVATRTTRVPAAVCIL